MKRKKREVLYKTITACRKAAADYSCTTFDPAGKCEEFVGAYCPETYNQDQYSNMVCDALCVWSREAMRTRKWWLFSILRRSYQQHKWFATLLQWKLILEIYFSIFELLFCWFATQTHIYIYLLVRIKTHSFEFCYLLNLWISNQNSKINDDVIRIDFGGRYWYIFWIMFDSLPQLLIIINHQVRKRKTVNVIFLSLEVKYIVYNI